MPLSRDNLCVMAEVFFCSGELWIFLNFFRIVVNDHAARREVRDGTFNTGVACDEVRHLFRKFVIADNRAVAQANSVPAKTM